MTVITGQNGTGKSFLASAIGQQGCLLGLKVLYTNVAKLMSYLKMAKVAGEKFFDTMMPSI
ncbi:MAG: ATP-binding protein [Bacteroidota bacterium]